MNFEIQTSSYFDAEAKRLLYDKADASSIKMNDSLLTLVFVE